MTALATTAADHIADLLLFHSNVNLTYWGNGQGFVKAMLPINVPKNGGPVWIAGVTTDASGDAMYGLLLLSSCTHTALVMVRHSLASLLLPQVLRVLQEWACSWRRSRLFLCIMGSCKVERHC